MPETLLPPTITLRFIRGTAWDSRAIEWGTWSWCSHVEAVLPGQQTLGALFRGGVRIRKYSDPCYRGVAFGETWRIPCTAEQQKGFYDFLQLQIGKPYDWRAIVSFIVKARDWRSEDAWICSELDARALELVHLLRLIQVPANRVSPGLLYALVQQIPGSWEVRPYGMHSFAPVE